MAARPQGEPQEAFASLSVALCVWTGSRAGCGLSGHEGGSVYRSLCGELKGQQRKPGEWGPQTHRGAEWGHPPVAGTDGQVIEGNGFPVQLHILPDAQHTFHGRDQKLPWCHPGEARVRWEWPGEMGSPGLSPRPLASRTRQGCGTVLQCTQLQILMGPATGRKCRKEGYGLLLGGAGSPGPTHALMCLRCQASFFPWPVGRRGADTG